MSISIPRWWLLFCSSESNTNANNYFFFSQVVIFNETQSMTNYIIGLLYYVWASAKTSLDVCRCEYKNKKYCYEFGSVLRPVMKAIQSSNKVLKPFWKWQYQRLKSVSKMLSGYTKLKSGHLNIIIDLILNEKNKIKLQAWDRSIDPHPR